MDLKYILTEAIGWISTALFLISIIIPQRVHLHILGIFASVTTGYYAYAHGATAIWVKWSIALLFHSYMIYKVKKASAAQNSAIPQKVATES